MISKMYLFIQKSFLYLAAMIFALMIAYYGGMSPLLRAQTPESSLQAGNQTNQPVSGSATTPENSLNSAPVYNEVDLKSIEQDLKIKAGQTVVSPQEIPSSNVSSSPKGFVPKYSQSYVGDLSSFERDPFRKPEYLLELEEKEGAPKIVQDSTLDEKMEAIRRWPLNSYRLIGIIWDVKNPKVMIEDPTNTKHLLKRNYRIGNKNGLVSEIGEGSITVLEEGVPVVISLLGGGKK